MGVRCAYNKEENFQILLLLWMTAYQQIIHDVQLPAAQVLHPYTVVVQYFKCQLLVFRKHRSQWKYGTQKCENA